MKNLALQRLKAGELSLGVILRQARAVEIAKIMKTAGYDWLFLDLEHNAMSIETASDIAIAALDVGIAPLVRVPEGQFWLATRALDGGALGIVMPHVDTAEQAREVVQQLRYPPKGRRSISSLQAHVDFQSTPLSELTKALDEECLIAVMLETKDAISNADEIAAVEGIDVLLIGANDLCLDLGIPGQIGNARVSDAFARVISACTKHSKWPGMGGIHVVDDVKRYLDMGMRFLLAGNDVSLILAAGKDRTSKIRSLFKQRSR